MCPLLPPTRECMKVMFSLCVSVHMGGGATLVPNPATRCLWMGGLNLVPFHPLGVIANGGYLLGTDFIHQVSLLGAGGTSFGHEEVRPSQKNSKKMFYEIFFWGGG